MLFKQHILERIARGEVTVAFRKWQRPTVKAGGRLRTPVGELAIDLVAPTTPQEITEGQAVAAGFASRAEALAGFASGDGQLYRIDFRLERADPRKALVDTDDLDADAATMISTALLNLDRRSRTGDWTMPFLSLVQDHPGLAAANLACLAGLQTPLFKRRMQQLKELGLTQSLDVGYRLSPRGARFMTLRTLAADPSRHDRGDRERVLIRDPGSGDVEVLAQIWVEGWNDAHAGILPPEVAKVRTLADLRARLLGNLENTSVAVSKGRPVGLAMVKKDELDQLYVSRDARGTGVAAALVADALDRIRRAGYRRAWLSCAIGNHRAARFYQKSGWSLEGVVTIRLEARAGPVALDVWRYEIAL